MAALLHASLYQDLIKKIQMFLYIFKLSQKPAKTMNRFQKQFRKFKDRKQLMGKGDQRAVNISIEGRHMSL